MRNADTTEQSDNSSSRSSLRSILLLGAALLCLAAGLWSYVYLLTPVRYELSLQPESLPAIPGASVELRAEGINRIGSAVPWSAQPLRCSLLEGEGLVELLYNADSSMVTVTSLGHEGLVQLRITVANWPFPLLASLRILAPLALFHFPSHHPVHTA
ncbi:MAG: hypothetical protein M5R41_03165 [Bacteroidia bacterium]|nr:hypothetical protein [Bacteroidia bacterium]